MNSHQTALLAQAYRRVSYWPFLQIAISGVTHSDNSFVSRNALLSSMRIFAVCLLLSIQWGCALFPPNVTPQDSVFVDGNLAESSKITLGNQNTTLKADLGANVVDKWRELNDPEGDDPTSAREFLLAGVSLVDARCDEYFRQLGIAAQKTSFANKELNLTTSVVAALQGLTAVSSKDIALTATSLGYLSASSNAYNDVFIFSPDVSSVQALVANSQKAAKDKINGIEKGDFSKSIAIGLLQDYEMTCEIHTIRRLVNESLSSAKPVASFSSADQPSELLRQATRSALAGAVGVDGITERQLVALYWLAFGDQRTDDDTKALVKVLPEKLLSDTKQLTDAAALEKVLVKVRSAFRALVAVEATALDTESAALKKMLEASGDGQVGTGTEKTPAVAPKLFAPALTIRIKQQ